MARIEIERHESPYSNADQQFPILAPPPCGGGCSSCCCCCSSSFIIPEGIILKKAAATSSSKLNYTQKALLIYGIGFIAFIAVNVLLGLIINGSVAAEGVFLILAFFGVFGACLINPIVVRTLKRKESSNDTLMSTLKDRYAQKDEFQFCGECGGKLDKINWVCTKCGTNAPKPNQNPINQVLKEHSVNTKTDNQPTGLYIFLLGLLGFGIYIALFIVENGLPFGNIIGL